MLDRGEPLVPEVRAAARPSAPVEIDAIDKVIHYTTFSFFGWLTFAGIAVSASARGQMAILITLTKWGRSSMPIIRNES